MLEEEDKIDEIVNPEPETDDEVDDEAEESEIVPETENLPTILPTKKGKLSLRYKTIAEYAARGYSVDIISQVTGMTPSAIYRVLDKNVLVWEEINRIMANMFAEGDRVLKNLYLKALYKLDERMNRPETEEDAIRKVMDVIGKRVASSGKEGEKPPIIQQFFQTGGSSEGPIVEGGTIDDLILKKRKERGLDLPKKQPVRAKDDDEDDEQE